MSTPTSSPSTRAAGRPSATSARAARPALRRRHWRTLVTGAALVALVVPEPFATQHYALAAGVSTLDGGKWAVAAKQATRTRTPSPVAGVAWSDEFDSLDLTTPAHAGVWRPNDIWQNISRGYEDFAGTSWNLNPNETPGNNPFSVSNGTLKITATPTPPSLMSTIQSSMAAQGQSGPVPQWSGGMLITNSNVRQFRYGYFEVRARFPEHAAGMFPAMWLYAAQGSNNPEGKGGAEIDMFEIFGDPTGQHWNITLHYIDNSGNYVRNSVHVAEITTDTTQWHTYAMDWQPTYLRFYLDGKQVAEVTGDAAAWFNTNMSFRLNYSMDAPWFPSASRAAASSATQLTMEVDYVRVFPARPA